MTERHSVFDPKNDADSGSAGLLDSIIKMVEREAASMDVTPAAALWLLQDRPSLSQIAERG